MFLGPPAGVFCRQGNTGQARTVAYLPGSGVVMEGAGLVLANLWRHRVEQNLCLSVALLNPLAHTGQMA